MTAEWDDKSVWLGLVWLGLVWRVPGPVSTFGFFVGRKRPFPDEGLRWLSVITWSSFPRRSSNPMLASKNGWLALVSSLCLAGFAIPIIEVAEPPAARAAPAPAAGGPVDKILTIVEKLQSKINAIQSTIANVKSDTGGLQTVKNKIDMAFSSLDTNLFSEASDAIADLKKNVQAEIMAFNDYENLGVGVAFKADLIALIQDIEGIQNQVAVLQGSPAQVSLQWFVDIVSGLNPKALYPMYYVLVGSQQEGASGFGDPWITLKDAPAIAKQSLTFLIDAIQDADFCRFSSEHPELSDAIENVTKASGILKAAAAGLTFKGKEKAVMAGVHGYFSTITIDGKVIKLGVFLGKLAERMDKAVATVSDKIRDCKNDKLRRQVDEMGEQVDDMLMNQRRMMLLLNELKAGN